MMTVVDLVARNARMYPDGIAFVEVRPISNRRTEITWRAFNERMNRIARVLSAKGVKKGMKVALMGRNSIAWLEVFFGIITRQAIRRGSFDSVKALVSAIHAFIDGWNERCHPFTWTKTPDEILPRATRKRDSDARH